MFDGLFILTLMSSSRLCQSYVAEAAKRARKKVLERIQSYAPKRGEKLRLVTLTMPTIKGVGLEKTFEIFDDAWRRFRKCAWWRKRVRGGCKGEEFTLGDKKRLEDEHRAWDFELDGYHVHAHILVWSEWLVWTELGEQWAIFLERAAKKKGVEMKFATSHGRPVVDIRLVTHKKRSKGTVSHQGAVYETCKYLVKGVEFAKVPAAQLVDVERTLRNRRMVELLGKCNNRKGSVKGRQSRSNAGSMSLEEARRLVEWVDDAPEGMRSDVRADKLTAARERVQTYIYEQEQLTARGMSHKEFLKALRVKGVRPPPLREIGAEMIRKGERQKWLDYIKIIASERREWRRSALRRRFPYATFRPLGGKPFYGLLANPACSFDTDAMYKHRSGVESYYELTLWLLLILTQGTCTAATLNLIVKLLHLILDDGEGHTAKIGLDERDGRNSLAMEDEDRSKWQHAAAEREAWDEFEKYYIWEDWRGVSKAEAFEIQRDYFLERCHLMKLSGRDRQLFQLANVGVEIGAAHLTESATNA